MTEKLRVVVADDESFICNMLARIIRWDELGLTLAGTAHDGAELLEVIAAENPDIAVTDISMPKMDGLEVIRSVRESGGRCRFIIISGYQHYRYACNTLRYDVDDYLVKPVDETELNTALALIARSLRSTDDPAAARSERTRRAAFVEEGMYALRTEPRTIEELNAAWGLRLRPGVFRVAFTKLERSRQEEDVSSVVAKLRSVTESVLAPLCMELVCSESDEGVLALANYAPERAREVDHSLELLLEKARSVVGMFGGMGATVCAGEPETDAAQLARARLSVRDAEWARIFYGTGRVVSAGELPSVANEAVRLKREELLGEFTAAFRALDGDALRRSAESLFSFPMNVLRSRETREFIRTLLDTFLEVNRARLAAFDEPEHAVREMRRKLDNCTRVTEYIPAFQRVFTEEMERIRSFELARERGVLETLERQLAACGGTLPGLHSAAAAAGLEPEALRELLLRRTGGDYAAFAAEKRIEHAKAHLRAGRKPDRALAAELGFSGEREFKREFKRLVGVAPAQYARIFR